jgi:hypothetical protein
MWKASVRCAGNHPIAIWAMLAFGETATTAKPAVAPEL